MPRADRSSIIILEHSPMPDSVESARYKSSVYKGMSSKALHFSFALITIDIERSAMRIQWSRKAFMYDVRWH